MLLRKSQVLPYKNRRMSYRVPVNWLVAFRPENGEDRWTIAEAEDCSRVGMRLAAAEPLDPGMALDLCLHLPQLLSPVTLQGSIIRPGAVRPDGWTTHGISFSKEFSLLMLLSFVEEHAGSSGGTLSYWRIGNGDREEST